jgi:hypothetical protein
MPHCAGVGAPAEVAAAGTSCATKYVVGQRPSATTSAILVVLVCLSFKIADDGRSL